MSIALHHDDIECDGEIEVFAEWDKAASRILWRPWGDTEWQPTAFVSSDVDHDPNQALIKVSRWLDS